MGEPEDEKDNKLSDDVVLFNFMRKRSETEDPRYTVRLKKFAELRRKRRRADTARRNYVNRKDCAVKKPLENDNNIENAERQAEEEHMRMRKDGERCNHRSGSRSESRGSRAPSDACCRRRRRRRSRCRRRRRRRRSCSRRRRRRCGRRRRRRRRSCSRRRRRRSCRRRRRCGRRRRRR